MAFQGHRGVQRYDGSTAASWQNFICGHCNRNVSGAIIASLESNRKGNYTKWLLCPSCNEGSVEDATSLCHPSAAFGPPLEGLPTDVEEAYSESRRCFAVGAYTACELLCRKILMHVGVEKGHTEGKGFVEYINYLEGQGYVTPPMKHWVDLIRKHGNDSTHKLARPDRQHAEGTLMFTAELLRLIYEMEHMAQKYVVPK